MIPRDPFSECLLCDRPHIVGSPLCSEHNTPERQAAFAKVTQSQDFPVGWRRLCAKLRQETA